MFPRSTYKPRLLSITASCNSHRLGAASCDSGTCAPSSGRATGSSSAGPAKSAISHASSRASLGACLGQTTRTVVICALSEEMQHALSRVANAGYGHVGLPTSLPLSQRSHRVMLQHHPSPRIKCAPFCHVLHLAVSPANWCTSESTPAAYGPELSETVLGLSDRR